MSITSFFPSVIGWSSKSEVISGALAGAVVHMGNLHDVEECVARSMGSGRGQRSESAWSKYSAHMFGSSSKRSGEGKEKGGGWCL